MNAARVKISHKKFKEFKNMYYYFLNKGEFYYYIKKIYEGGFKIEEIKIKGKVEESFEYFLLLMIFEDIYTDDYIEKNLEELRGVLYA